MQSINGTRIGLQGPLIHIWLAPVTTQLIWSKLRQQYFFTRTLQFIFTFINPAEASEVHLVWAVEHNYIFA